MRTHADPPPPTHRRDGCERAKEQQDAKRQAAAALLLRLLIRLTTHPRRYLLLLLLLHRHRLHWQPQSALRKVQILPAAWQLTRATSATILVSSSCAGRNRQARAAHGGLTSPRHDGPPPTATGMFTLSVDGLRSARQRWTREQAQRVACGASGARPAAPWPTRSASMAEGGELACAGCAASVLIC